MNQAYADAFKMIHDDEGEQFVLLVVDSYGGYVDNLSILLSEIEASEKPVVTIAQGCAMSCGAVLAASGSPGLRYVSKFTNYMIHEASSFAFGRSSDVLNDAKALQRTTDMLLAQFDKNAGKEIGFTANLLKENRNADLFLSAEEVVNYGFADHIASRNQAFKRISKDFEQYKKRKK